jgi:FkbM family methyltransferase
VGKGLALRNKWQVSSARDVFLSAHYWRVFEYLSAPPQLVMDLGAHCGHFIVLLHCLLQEKFGRDTARYVAIEGLAEMIPQIETAVEDVGIKESVSIVHGLVGGLEGAAVLRSGSSSRMDSSVVYDGRHKSRRGSLVRYVNPLSLISSCAKIDVLKVDIEGSEYDLLRNIPELFERADICLMELHDVQAGGAETIKRLHALGLRVVSNPIAKGTEQLLLLKRA